MIGDLVKHMSKDKYKEKTETRRQIDWESLIEDTDREIQATMERLSKLRSSVKFFRKKRDAGERFPEVSL
jgi:hypothetical protein